MTWTLNKNLEMDMKIYVGHNKKEHGQGQELRNGDDYVH